jgi:hypothetical protein
MNGHRSFFFPMLLIGAGVLWLLISLGYIPSSNLWALAHVWPILLIGAGLGLILRQYWSEAGILVSTLVVLAAVLAVVYAPQIGWTEMPAWGFDFDVNGSVAGSRVIVSETRQVSGFTNMDFHYPANITIQQGTEESVTITADDNLLPQLSTEVSGGTLTIRSDERNWNQRVNPSKTVEIEVTVMDLNRVTIQTAGSIHAEGLNGDHLEIRVDGAGSIELLDLQLTSLSLDMNGAGSVTATGSADELKAEIDGLGSLNAEGLSTQIAEVHISGLGSAELRVAQELTVEIDGAGSVNYHGSPVVHQQVDGVGSVNQVED